MSRSVKERLTEVVVDIFPDFKDGVSFESMGMDSLDLVELITETEEEFNISISEDHSKDIAKGTFQGLVSYIEERLEN